MFLYLLYSIAIQRKEFLYYMRQNFCIIDNLPKDWNENEYIVDMRYDSDYENIPFLHYPEEYNGQSVVKLCCTQHQYVSEHEQKKLTESWIHFLSKNKLPLKQVQFCTGSSQKIFDAICTQDSIESLRFKWMRCKDLSAIANLKNLKKLYLGYATSLVDISPLATLKNLEVLVFHCTTKLHDYSPVGALKNLKFLSFEEHIAYRTPMDMDSDSFLKNLTQLEYLDMTSVRLKERIWLTEENVKHFKFAGFRI